MTPEQLAEHVRGMVDDWPPFTPDQRSRLAVLVRQDAHLVTRRPTTGSQAREAA